MIVIYTCFLYENWPERATTNSLYFLLGYLNIIYIAISSSLKATHLTSMTTDFGSFLVSGVTLVERSSLEQL